MAALCAIVCAVVCLCAPSLLLQHSLLAQPEQPAMSDTVIDLTLSDDVGDSPYSLMSDFSDVSANQQAGECSDMADLVSEPVTAGDTGCVVISDDSSLLDSR